MFDEASAKNVPNWLQNALFMMAVSNSCMNPVVYGSYAINFRKEFCKCLGCLGRSDNNFPSKMALDAVCREGEAYFLLHTKVGVLELLENKIET